MGRWYSQGEPIQNANGFQQKTISTSAADIADTIPDKAGEAVVMVEPTSTKPDDQDISLRYQMNGSDPSSSSGLFLGLYDVLHVKEREQIKNFRCIRASNQDVKINVHFYVTT